MKENALQKSLLAPGEAVVRELVIAKNAKTPDLATVKDFLRFKAAAGKGRIVEQTTCDSLNTFAEWFSPASPVLRTLSIVDILSIMFSVRHRRRH